MNIYAEGILVFVPYIKLLTNSFIKTINALIKWKANKHFHPFSYAPFPKSPGT